MKSLWERGQPRGQCGKAAVCGMIVGLAVSAAVVAAKLAGLF